MGKSFKRHIYQLIIGFLVFVSLALSCLLYWHLRKNVSDVLQKTVTLKALPIKGEDIAVTRNYVGYTEAINQVQIIPYLSGYLDKISVKPGQIVKENDLLLTIEDSEYKAKLDMANASVLQAEASFNYNKNYYERVQKSGTKAFSAIDIENAQNNYLQSDAALKSAYANKNLAEVNYNYTKITAPIAGLVGNFNLSHGHYVTPNGECLLNIVQTNPIRVVFSLTDKEYLEHLEQGTAFKDSVINLILSNGKPFKYAGHIKYTDNQINKPTNSLAVYAYFENKDNELLPNAFVTVEISETFKDSVFIDRNLVKMEADGNYLPIGRNGQIIIEPVQILAEKENKYILRNSFKPNDVIILDDIADLPPQTKIHFNLIKS